MGRFRDVRFIASEYRGITSNEACQISLYDSR